MTYIFKNPCSHGARLDFGHLGGTSTGGDPDSWFPEMWMMLSRLFAAETFIDIGCGVGYAQRFMTQNGLLTMGVDCEQVLAHHVDKDGLKSAHDFTEGPWMDPQKTRYDISWCCEVAEHIEAQHSHNLVETLAACTGKVMGFCAAPPGCGGYHHVFCRPTSYWIETIEAAGLKFDENLTVQCLELAGEACGRGPRNYFRRSGLIFTRE